MENSRRDFLKKSAFFVAALPLAGSLDLVSRTFGSFAQAAGNKEVALPAGKTAVLESDPIASAIGYKADPAKIDFKKYPQRDPKKNKAAASQSCANCALYTKANEGWGQCQMIASGVVAAHGWCGSWSKKA